MSDTYALYKTLMDVNSTFVKGKDGKGYFVTADFSDATTWFFLVKESASGLNKITKYAVDFRSLDDNWGTLEEVAPYLGQLSKAASTAYTLHKFADERDERNRQIMMNSGIKDKDSALLKSNELYDDQLYYTLLMATLPMIITAAGITGPLAIGFTALTGLIGATSGFFWKARIAQIMGQGASVRWAIDPSGYVYEGVTNNRLQDVKVTAYYKESLEDTAAVLWDAGEYDQINPLFTNLNGEYAWDVPEGYWQVKCEKEGYETAYSEWLLVPPPQTSVNMKMVPSGDLEIASLQVYPNYAEITFSQYVHPNEVADIVLKDARGNTLTYTMDYDTSGTDESGAVFAKSFRLSYENAVLGEDEEFTVVIPETIVSADGRKMTSVTKTQPVQKEMTVVVPEVISIALGATMQVPINVCNYEKGKKILAVSGFEAILAVEQEAEIGEDGRGYLTVTGKLYGETNIILYIENQSKQMKIPVIVCDETNVGAEKYQVSYLAGGGAAGTPPAPALYGEGEQFALPHNTFVKEGMVFAGWSDGTAVYQEGAVYTMPQRPVVFTAHWTRKENDNNTGNAGQDTFTYARNSDGATVTITKCTSPKEHIEIPAVIDGYSVTEIGSHAFENMTGLKTVQIPRGITQIGVYAFAGCVSLTSVELLDSVRTIKSFAFYGCTALKSVRLFRSLVSVEENAFLDTGISVIYYDGTSSDWKGITIEAAGNDAFLNATVTGTDGKTFSANKNNWNTQKPTQKPVKKPSVSKVKSFKIKPGKKKLAMSWKKLSGVAGYQLQVSTKKNFKGAKTISLSKSKKSYTKKGLKAKSKYYVRIRAFKIYRNAKGKTQKVYGKWVTGSKKTK